METDRRMRHRATRRRRLGWLAVVGLIAAAAAATRNVAWLGCLAYLGVLGLMVIEGVAGRRAPAA